MLFNSIPFLIFLIIVIAVYYPLPKRYRYIWLLAASYVFYLRQDSSCVILLIITTLVTYFGGLCISASSDVRLRKVYAASALIINFGILAYFKYIDVVLSLFTKDGKLNLLLPIGISFYTFQSVTYIVDLCRGKIECEKNPAKLALFVSFFPTLLSGPIQRASMLLPQFTCTNDFSLESFKRGMQRMLWGFFLKLVISARLNIWLDTVHSSYTSFSGALLALTSIMYVFLVYSDFEGYSQIAIGVGEMLGFEMPANFKQPLLSEGFGEFWRRWHISLSSWLRDYVYIPLGGSRRGTVRKYINVVIVFLVSGIWHGGTILFIIWGFLNGIFQVIGALLMPLRQAIISAVSLNRHPALLRALRCIGTTLLYAFTMIFFSCDSLDTALGIIGRIFTDFEIGTLVNGAVSTLGLGYKNLAVVIFALMILAITDILCDRFDCDITGLLKRTPTVVRWMSYYVLLTMILLSATLSSQEFIYSQL